MKVFAISLVKNEEDIIAYNLAIASQWAEKIFVMDNGSEDNTWEIVQELAKTNPKVIPWKKEAKPFRDEIRGEIFNKFRHFAKEGDWWCFRLDSDEFYVDDPREFLAKVPAIYHVVCDDKIEYFITHEDVEEFSFKGEIPYDLKFIEYYTPTTCSEKRFFRHRDKLEWPMSGGWTIPKNIGVICPKKIRLRHYQWRSPQQIQKRLDTRNEATRLGYKHFGHSSEKLWKEKLLYRKDLVKDTHDGIFKITGCRNPHLPKFYFQWIKILLHYLKILP